MDKSTRNLIQKATQDARRLLEAEFSQQMEGLFDILPDGTIAPEPGKHLDATQRINRQKIVAAIEHEKASGSSDSEAVAAYLRETSFTYLNRFVALKMLEARGLAQECVSKGERSSGFKEFSGLAPGLAELPDRGYRLYIESLFDELSLEIRVLFDRQNPASLLWPRRKALDELLSILNREEIEGIWEEDETIGWVYQYFNSGEERKAMRDASKAPRNSRELAVRNQFYTPRYVVEFLTDNTLGRIWYEMRKGDTVLKDECQYFVRRPNEIFLAPGENPPVDQENDTDLSQEELQKKTVYFEHRSKKDPRDLRVLDPACGSGHFLLYAFDLLVRIYEEAWEDHESPESEATGHTLRKDFETLDYMCRAVPQLIIEHNLHGIDIDPRAVQIAALALWLRAQKTWKYLGISAAERPRVAKSNIVTAEPMPGEEDMRHEFTESLKPRVLGQLVDVVFDKLKLAGEAGSLLKIEEEIKDAVTEARKQWLEVPKPEQQVLFPGMADPRPKQKELRFDFKGVTDERFWGKAENLILEALEAYAEQAENGHAIRRRLFSEDAARGFAFIDLCRKRYDTVLMNPPFGDGTALILNYRDNEYFLAKADMGMCFVDRAVQLLAERGLMGSITTRTFIANDNLMKWRDVRLLGEDALCFFCDLGYGVLDAMVEASAFTIESPRVTSNSVFFFNLLNEKDKANSLLYAVRTQDNPFLFIHRTSSLRKSPSFVLAYWLPETTMSRFLVQDTLKSQGGYAAQGLKTTDDFRFLRLAWEAPIELIGSKQQWVYFAKGGEYNPYWDDIHLVVNWKEDGREIKALIDQKIGAPGAWSRWVNAIDWYFRPGLTFPERTTSDFSPRILPSGCIFSATGQGIFFESSSLALSYLAGAYTRPFKCLIEAMSGSGDSSVSGSAAHHYRCGLLNSMPPPCMELPTDILQLIKGLVEAARDLSTVDETSRYFEGYSAIEQKAFTEIVSWYSNKEQKVALRAIDVNLRVEKRVAAFLGMDGSGSKAFEELIGAHPDEYNSLFTGDLKELRELWKKSDSDLIAQTVEKIGARRQITKKSYFGHRKLELLSHYYKIKPSSLVEVAHLDKEPHPLLSDNYAKAFISFAVGRAFGRWRKIKASRSNYGLFDELPAKPPALLQNSTTSLSVMDDDPGGSSDITLAVERELMSLMPNIEHPFSEISTYFSSRSKTVRDYLRLDFFGNHLKTYSKSRRKAPIYWQLSTSSASYSVWLYYHRFTKDTFYKVLNDFLIPKLQFEEKELNNGLQGYGANPTVNQRKEIVARETFVTELKTFKDEVTRIAPLWNPDLNDGVIVNFAPLWRLVPQSRSWQKECKKVWDRLVNGDYDWAHLALHLWPERVVKKCAKDRSLAIAHGLEEGFWEEGDKGKWKPKKVSKETIDALIQERTSSTVQAALEDLLKAPIPANMAGKKRKKKA